MLPTIYKYYTPLPSLRSFNTAPKTSTRTSSSTSPPSAIAATAQPSPQRYAIVGGGFAGVSVAWHLMKLSTPQSPIKIELYDAHGLGAGGSGAAAGLLHPYTPRGKLLWQGVTAFQASLDLVNAAEEASRTINDELDEEKQKKRKQFVWRNGLLRPARTAKQAKDFSKHSGMSSSDSESSAVCEARCINTNEELVKLVPGLDPKLLFPEKKEKEDKEKGGKQQEKAAAVGFFVEEAVVINPHEYLLALWESCLHHARTSSPLASAQLHQNRNILSLAQLESQDGPFDGIVVAAGAAVDSISETAGVLNLDLCQGYTLDMELPLETYENSDEKEERRNTLSLNFPEGAPGLLGSPYISPQGTNKLVVGATQRHECSLEEAVAALGPGSLQKKEGGEWKEAVEALVPAAAQLWPPLGSSSSSDSLSNTWQVENVRSGYRAIPQRTADGSIPYAGKLINNLIENSTADGDGGGDSVSSTSSTSSAGNDNNKKNWWVVGGLGARGLVYHGWLGQLVAAGMVAKRDDQLPRELRRWKMKVEEN